MIIAYDDYPYHQISSTFDGVATSDLRFFDRYWFSVSDPQRGFGLIAGLGIYKNTDVVDGFLSFSDDRHQTNIRVSRSLRPDWTTYGSGPYQVQIIEPMQRHRIRLDPNDHGLRCDLEFEATTEPFGERKYHHQDRGWLEKDYVRMFQLARATGWIEVEGRRHDSPAEGWIAGRDRSFGTRPGMGGVAPRRGAKDLGSGIGAREALVVGTAFQTGSYHGSWTLAESADGTSLYSTGTLYSRAGEEIAITRCEHDLVFSPGTRAIERGRFVLRDDSGRHWIIEVTAGPKFVYQGFGYLDGWHDRAGLGVFRGADVVEGERFDLSDLAHIVDESGTLELGKLGMFHTLFRMTLQEQGCDIEEGDGEGIFLLLPEHQRYGNERP